MSGTTERRTRRQHRREVGPRHRLPGHHRHPPGGRLPTAGIAEVEGPVHVRPAPGDQPLPGAQRGPAALRPLMESAARGSSIRHIESGARMDLVDGLSPARCPPCSPWRSSGLPLDDWALYAEFFHGTMAHDPASRSSNGHRPRAVDDAAAGGGRRGDRRPNRQRSDLVTMEVPRRRRQPPAHRRRGALRAVEPGGRRPRHHHLADIAEPSALGPAPRAAPAAHRRPRPDGGATEEMLRFFSVNETLTRTVLLTPSSAASSSPAATT